MASHKEKKPTDPLVSFRCEPEAVAAFERNVAALGWHQPETLRQLLKSFNELFVERAGNLKWPVRVNDSSAEASQPRELAVSESALDDLAELLVARVRAKLEKESSHRRR